MTENNCPKVKEYPAPWNLRGKGYIMIYKFKKSFVEKDCNVPDFLKGKYAGGFGAVMLVDYEESNAGPYGELLFIPGKFLFRGKRLDTISKIYVSSYESVVNGRKNWGIPKEKAEFTFKNYNDREEIITIKSGDTEVAKFKIASGKLPFPVSTKLLPFPLVQKHEGKFMFTNFFGKGTGRLARLKALRINRNMFPNIEGLCPIAVVKVDPFNITFPVAETHEG